MKLWIDDIRPIPYGYDVWAKNYDEAILAFKTGKVTHASFDHDLDTKLEVPEDNIIPASYVEEKNGYEIAKWVEKQAYLNKIKPFTWKVHSANPVGAERIRMALSMADQYWEHHKNKEK